MSDIFVRDSYRQAVEAATGGKCTVLYDDMGNPGIYNYLDRFNIEQVDPTRRKIVSIAPCDTTGASSVYGGDSTNGYNILVTTSTPHEFKVGWPVSIYGIQYKSELNGGPVKLPTAGSGGTITSHYDDYYNNVRIDQTPDASYNINRCYRVGHIPSPMSFVAQVGTNRPWVEVNQYSSPANVVRSCDFASCGMMGYGVHPAFISSIMTILAGSSPYDGIQLSINSGVLISTYNNVVIGNDEDTERLVSLTRGNLFRNRPVSEQLLEYTNWRKMAKKKCGGMHIMTNWEWSAAALYAYAMRGGIGNLSAAQPGGNVNFGLSDPNKDNFWESGSTQEGGYYLGFDPYSSSSATISPTYGPVYGGTTLAGSGPASWRHDNTHTGIADLFGNMGEFVEGVRLVNGQIYMTRYNDTKYLDSTDHLTYKSDGIGLNDYLTRMNYWWQTGVYLDGTSGTDYTYATGINNSGWFIEHLRMNWLAPNQVAANLNAVPLVLGGDAITANNSGQINGLSSELNWDGPNHQNYINGNFGYELHKYGWGPQDYVLGNDSTSKMFFGSSYVTSSITDGASQAIKQYLISALIDPTWAESRAFSGAITVSANTGVRYLHRSSMYRNTNRSCMFSYSFNNDQIGLYNTSCRTSLS